MTLTADIQDLFGELHYPSIESLNLDNLSLVDFAYMVHWISNQLHFYLKTDSLVHPIKDENDLDSFKVELNSLFVEVGSIFSNNFFTNTINDRLSILHSLSGDLFAARIDYIKNFDTNNDFSNELNPKKDLLFINNCLSISDDLKDFKSYFHKIKEKLNKNYLKLHEEDSLLLPDNKTLNRNQWSELKKLNENFRKEYSIRREMLLRRADTTISSFCWKDDKSREIDEKTIKNIYSKTRMKLMSNPSVTLAHALSARSSDCNSLINDVISTNHASCLIEVPAFNKANQGTQQRLQLHKFLIGAVPDRGGRPDEQPVPQKESFNHQQQQRERFSQRGRGGGNREHNRNSHGSNFQQQKYIPEQSNRVQNAGWQQSGGSRYSHNDNYQNGRNPGRHHQDNYNQHNSGYQRFSGHSNNGNNRQGYYNYNNEFGQQTRGRGRGGGQYRSNRY